MLIMSGSLDHHAASLLVMTVVGRSGLHGEKFFDFFFIVPKARLRHDIPKARLRHDIPKARLRHDIPKARLRHDKALLSC